MTNLYETPSLIQSIFQYKDGVLYWNADISRKAKKGAVAGSTKTSVHGYCVITYKRKHYKRSRLVFLMHNGYLPDSVDHINGCKSDDRIENLRPCTQSQNNCNAKLSKNNKSGVKGVYWSEREGKWKAEISMNNNVMKLGTFSSLDDADKVVREARKKIHREFARFK